MKKLRFYRRRLGLSGLRLLYLNLEPADAVPEPFTEEIPDTRPQVRQSVAVSCGPESVSGRSLVARKGLT
ncbi:MAG TPA: hypothetical protein VF630_03855 [Hymenobacter sp.]